MVEGKREKKKRERRRRREREGGGGERQARPTELNLGGVETTMGVSNISDF